jgi:outer membrane receptor protein involved in Fe transport
VKVNGTAVVALQYDLPIGDMLLSLIGDATYRSKSNTEFRPDSPFNIELDSYTQVNLFANLAINEKMTFGAYVKNLTNEVGVIDGVSTFQDPKAIVALRPRTIGLRFLWRY